MLQDASQTIAKPRLEIGSNEMEEAVRRSRAALNRVQRGQVSRARQELTGAALGPKNMDTLAELQGRRPSERVVDISQEVTTLVPDRPDELDTKWFTKVRAKCTFRMLATSWRMQKRDVAFVLE